MPDKLISLPPLDHLQQHRRGSLTDPSLHSLLGPRPAANYVFGDTEPKQMRKILRSPSLDRDLDHHPRQNGLSSTSLSSSPHTSPHLSPQETPRAIRSTSTPTDSPPAPPSATTTTATTALVATPLQYVLLPALPSLPIIRPRTRPTPSSHMAQNAKCPPTAPATTSTPTSPVQAYRAR